MEPEEFAIIGRKRGLMGKRGLYIYLFCPPRARLLILYP
jgi:hypothetical protein